MQGISAGAAALPKHVKILGTVFLVFQLLFALNNYGPQRVVLLGRLVTHPFVSAIRPPSWKSSEKAMLQDISSKAGLGGFARPLINDAQPLYIEVMGGGLAVGDVDGDGREDVFLTSMPSFLKYDKAGAAGSTLFRNRGDGSYEDITAASGLEQMKGYPQGALFFDYDNDGDQDLYVAAYDGGQLFRNAGGRFEDVTAAAGLDLKGRCGALPCMGSSASAADYDRDGRLDLLIVNNVAWDINDPAQHERRFLFPAFSEAQPSFLMRGRPDGTFEDVSAASGLTNAEGKGLQALWTDVNQDGWPDVYISNDLSHNALYLNQQNGTFLEFARGAGVDEIKSSMGLSSADFDNDGDFDLAVTNLKGAKVSLFKNLGDNRFDYATNYSGLAPSGRTSGWGVEFVDFDLDGFLDLVVAGGPVWEETPRDTEELVFRNLGDGRFEDAIDASGRLRDGSVSRGLAVTDHDADGRPDLMIANIDGGSPMLVETNGQPGAHWLKVALRGTASNRDAVGARVELVRADGMRMVREVHAGSSYQSSSSKAVYFGLGASSAAEVVVRWPSGAVQRQTNLPLDGSVVIVEEAAAGAPAPQAAR